MPALLHGGQEQEQGVRHRDAVTPLSCQRAQPLSGAASFPAFATGGPGGMVVANPVLIREAAMRGLIFFGLALTISMAVAPRGARACGRGGGSNYSGLVTLALVVLSVDAGLTLWDGGSALASHHPSAGYGVLELIVAVPQLVLGAAATSHNAGGSSAFNWYTVWMGLMTAHGVWTIATAPSDDTPSKTWIRDRLSAPDQDKKPGALLSVGPTYVPLGERAHSGVGLLGRF